ncbi:MAG: hypothetical protein NUV61_00835 [Candidatus Azambacteria bacterium]|nr:hypothetical protein [Candidatus Azambacteria bacterium]
MGISLSLVFGILSLASFGGAMFIIAKKVPTLIQIPMESLPNQETFFAYIARIVRVLATTLHPKRIKMYALAQVAKVLHTSRLISFKMHRFIDTMAHTAKKKSQEMEQEHRLLSDAKQEEDDKSKEESKQEEESNTQHIQ